MLEKIFLKKVGYIWVFTFPLTIALDTLWYFDKLVYLKELSGSIPHKSYYDVQTLNNF